MMKSNMLFMLSMITIIFMMMMISSNTQMHPVLFMSLIIIYSMLMSMNLSTWKMNFIYSIMLFLIMISGLLIIFLYFSSLISNEKMTLMWNPFIIIMAISNSMFSIYYILSKKLFNYNLMFITKDNMTLREINNNMFQNIMNLYNYPFNNLTIMCMSFLLISLFLIIKISSMKSKPLRKISN